MLLQYKSKMLDETGSPRLCVRVCFQFSHPLLDRSKPLKCLAAVIFDVGMKDFELGGNVLDCAGQPDDSITGFISTSGKAHRAHSRNGNRCSSHCGNDFNHDNSGYSVILATLPSQLLFAPTLGA